ncbi:hypothetical protein COCNU_scaffold000979G000010 [Cocos nucifera]|nr:hypothetical protein [Cocos nucifera]
MTQELSATDNKGSSPAPAARVRISRTRDSPRTDSANGISQGLKTRPKVVPLEANSAQGVRRSIQQNKPKPWTDDVGAPKGREIENLKITSRPGNRVAEQYAWLRRRGDINCRGSDDEAVVRSKNCQDEKERLVKELQHEVVELRAQLERLQGLNVQLESQNKKLGEDLLAAEEKIRALERSKQVVPVGDEAKPSGFRDKQKRIASRLDQFRVKEVLREDTSMKIQSSSSKSRTKAGENPPKVLKELFSPPPTQVVPTSGPPPPPPPPPPHRPSHSIPARDKTVHKATALVELYHSLTRQDAKKDSVGNRNSASPVSSNVHNSIVGELQNRSAHLLAIKADVETKGDLIKQLIQKVQSASYMDMEDVRTFVDWLDGQLSTLPEMIPQKNCKMDNFSTCQDSNPLIALEMTPEERNRLAKKIKSLKRKGSSIRKTSKKARIDEPIPIMSIQADETAVLKHFNWPERKADALREAACEYRDLKQVEAEVSFLKDDASLPCDATLKKISNLLDKLERSMHRLIKLRSTSMLTFRECKIPTDWMLDSGMIKMASVELAKVYLKRVSMELESVRHSERESAQEALVFHGVRFAFRVHQFVGGLDTETMRAFEELRKKIQSKGKGSKGPASCYHNVLT